MPRISTFFGIAINMYYREHGPPHFHAIYAEHQALIEIETLSVLQGHLPPRALRLVLEWAGEYQADLRTVWDQARNTQPLDTIPPLE